MTERKITCDRSILEAALKQLAGRGYIFVNGFLQKEESRTIYRTVSEMDIYSRSESVAIYCYPIWAIHTIPKIDTIDNKLQGIVFSRFPFRGGPFIYISCSFRENVADVNSVLKPKFNKLSMEGYIFPDKIIKKDFSDLIKLLSMH
jgi:hypothetical protein